MPSLLYGEEERIPARLIVPEDRLRRLNSQNSRVSTPSLPSWLCRLLRIPLEMKLLAANLMITVVAVVLLFGPVRFQPNRLVDAMIIAIALGTGTLVNVFLVRLALRPIHSLTQVAWLVSQGLLGARVPSSRTADRQLTQLSATINELLDDLVRERAKISKLSGEPVATRLGVIRSARAFQGSLSPFLR